MKRKKFYLILLAVTLLSMPLFHSCHLDDNDRYYSAKWVALSTIQVIEGKDYYFLSDEDERIYPGDTTLIHRYKVEDGQRVWVYYDELENDLSGYEYNARIKHIENILTKGVVPITEEKQDSIGDDRINITAKWFGGDHLNISYQVLGNSNHLRMINLIRDLDNINDEDDEYVNLEFRHNAKGDVGREVLQGIVSFRKPFTNDPTKKGLRIRVNTIYNGEQYYTIDFDSKETPQGYMSNSIRVE